MENEVKTENTENVQFTADDYLKNLQAIKDNTVSKEEYNRLIEENKKMANALANGLSYQDDVDEEPEVDIDAVRERLFVKHKYNSDLEYFTDVLTLRKALMDKGQADPFLPTNPEYVWNQQDADRAQFIADEIQSAIDYSDGDKEVFRVELQRRCGVSPKR